MVRDDWHEADCAALMDLDVDASELREFAEDLGRIPASMVPKVEAVVRKAAVNIKQDWAQTWTGHAHIPALPKAISFDMLYGFGSIGAEIGPDKARTQGPLGNVIEFGTVNNAPIPGGYPALYKELPAFMLHLALVTGREIGDGR